MAYGKNNRDTFHGKAMMKTYFSKKAGQLAATVSSSKQQVVKNVVLVSVRPVSTTACHLHSWVNCITSLSLNFQIYILGIIKTSLTFQAVIRIIQVTHVKDMVKNIQKMQEFIF